MSLDKLHKKALKEGWAIPHFNFSSLAQLYGIVDAIVDAKSLALLGVSEGERAFMGINQVVSLVKSLQKEGIPVFLNADHCHSVESAKEAFNAGFDSVHIDLSKKSWKKNLSGTKEVVSYIKKRRPEVHVEGELGYIVTDSSKIYKKSISIPKDSYTKVKDAVLFVKETKIDRLAPSVGTIHGIAANTPHLKFDLIKELRKELKNTTLVLHGGSGVTDSEMKRAVKDGMNNIHVSTELRVAYTKSLRNTLKKNKEEIAPYHYLADPRKAVSKLVKEKLILFSAVNVV